MLAGCLDTFRSPSKSTVNELRIVGVDDGSFPRNQQTQREVIIVAVLFHGLRVTGVRTSYIEVDGRDANARMASLLRKIRYDLAMLSGISFGGFNVVDIAKLAHDTKKPVIALTGERPRNAAAYRALRKHFSDWSERWAAVQSAGRLYTCKPLRSEPALFFEVKGTSAARAKQIIKGTAAISRLPEPIRVARILARAMSPIRTGA